jgi:transposase-like protein
VSFTPPVCPHRSCPAHRDPPESFFVRRGYYQPKCRAHPVPRFRCRVCGAGFSRQTFRHDYGDHKPHLNAVLLDALSNGSGFRELARRIPLTRRNVERKFRKIARTLGLLHRNLLAAMPANARFQLDEMISFEHCKSTRPLTVPVLIESRSFFVVAGASAPIRPSGRKTARRRAAIARDEERCGPRPHLDRPCVRGVLDVLAPLVAQHREVRLRTDCKPLYRTLGREVFGDRLVHERFSGRLRRGPGNPLFPINLTNAIVRQLLGRMRRRTWLCTKKHAFLDAHLHYFIVYRNYVRRRTNREPVWYTPAVALGLLEAPLRFEQCLSWRQDWGEHSLHPAHACPRSIDDVRRARRAA